MEDHPVRAFLAPDILSGQPFPAGQCSGPGMGLLPVDGGGHPGRAARLMDTATRTEGPPPEERGQVKPTMSTETPGVARHGLRAMVVAAASRPPEPMSCRASACTWLRKVFSSALHCVLIL